MKVLVLGWEYPPAVAGGLGAACHGLTTALADRGHDVVLATPGAPGDPPPPSHPRIERVPLDVSADGDASGVPLLSPYAVDVPVGPASDRNEATGRLYGGDLDAAIRRYTRRAVAELADHSFDVVHAHDWMTFPAALRLRFERQRPACVHVHSTAFDRGGVTPAGGIAAVERAGVRTADLVLAVSGYTRDVVVREYGVDPRRVRVVHNAPTGPLPERATERRTAGPPTVLFVGRLTRQKGVGFLLRAARRVLDERSDVRFVLVGDGDELRPMIELSASLGISRRVFFTGSVDDAARDRAYRDADVFVLSSISEPFGLTPLEALQHGAAVVLSDACGVREVLPSAPVVPPWDARGLADEILRIVSDESLREDLVGRGRAELQALSWDRSAEALERALEDAIRGDAGAAATA